MADPLIDFSPSSVTVNGRLFEGDVAVKLKNNLSVHVGALASDGVKRVRAGIKTKDGTGFTARNVEKHQRPANSLYATVRMKPDLSRPPGSARYPASRRPYIVNAVLENGRFGGQRVRIVTFSSTRARSRSRWQAGAQRQPALYMWRKAATALRARAKDIRENLLLRGL